MTSSLCTTKHQNSRDSLADEAENQFPRMSSDFFDKSVLNNYNNVMHRLGEAEGDLPVSWGKCGIEE